MSAGWEIVKTESGYHVTFQAENNEVMLSSEVLESLASAEDVPKTVVNLVLKAYNSDGPHIPVRFTDTTVQT